MGPDVEAGRTPSGHREQHVTRMQIVYQDLKYTVQVKTKKDGLVSRDILKGISGVIEPARMTAVMGASGAGKTTMLNVLAGFVKSGVKVSGSIGVNGLPVTPDKMRQVSAFVHQEDVILQTMTVREAVLFSAMLKLPPSMTREEKQRRALDVAALLNLTKTLDSVVGSATIKGISGGEKRRLSLACEMITNPSILWLDEPTTGLDTFTAYKVAKILVTLAQLHHRTVVCTIHQPSSDIFHMFDDLIVLADGQELYHGAAAEMVNWFSSLGHVCPQYTNPADYLFMDLLNVSIKGTHAADSEYNFIGKSPSDVALNDADGKQAAAAAASRHAATAAVADVRLAELIDAWASGPHTATLKRQFTERTGLLSTGISADAIQHKAPFLVQFVLLGQRAFKNAWRNPLIAKGKLAQTIFLSLVVGLIYLQVGSDLRGVQDRQGSLFFLVVQGLFGSVMGTLTVFGAEKAVFEREYSSRLYGLPAYFVSRWAVELPNQVAFPVLSAVIVYWMIGYQNTAEKFGWFALIQVLMDNCGAALGVFVSCLFNDISVALAVMPMFLLPLLIFSGFFVNSSTIPPYFNWIQYISPMHYGFVALAKNEFEGLEVHCTPDQDCAPGFDGYKVITNMGFDDKGSIAQNAGILFALVPSLLMLAYLALWHAVWRLTK